MLEGRHLAARLAQRVAQMVGLVFPDYGIAGRYLRTAFVVLGRVSQHLELADLEPKIRR